MHMSFPRASQYPSTATRPAPSHPPRSRQLARPLSRPSASPAAPAAPSDAAGAAGRLPASRPQTAPRVAPQPTEGPRGPVAWWLREAPGGDEDLWAAVVALHLIVQRRRLSTSTLAQRQRADGTPVSRETLSRVLNGCRRTTWRTVEALADCLDVPVPTADERRRVLDVCRRVTPPRHDARMGDIGTPIKRTVRRGVDDPVTEPTSSPVPAPAQAPARVSAQVRR